MESVIIAFSCTYKKGYSEIWNDKLMLLYNKAHKATLSLQ